MKQVKIVTEAGHDAELPKPRAKRTTIWSRNPFSNALFLWVWPWVVQCYSAASRPLLVALRSVESARYNGSRFMNLWEEMEGRPMSVFKALVRCYGWSYAMIGIYKIVWGIFTWLCAYYFLKSMLLFIEQQDALLLDGHLIALALFLSALFSSISIHQLHAECNRMAIKIKGALMVLIYRKALKLSRVRGGAGEIVNILSIDITAINDAVVNFHFLWSGLLEAVAIIVIAFLEMGLSAVPALVMVLVLIPIQMYLGHKTSIISRQQTLITTQRVHMMSEILTAIKLIKFYVWEKPFSEKIEASRQKELNLIYRGMMIKTINYMVVFAVPTIISLASFGMYMAMGYSLTASTSFTVLSVYNTLRYPFLMLPMAVKSTMSAKVSLDRLDEFMQSEEVVPLTVEAPKDSNLIFDMKNADFKWDGADGPTLKDINFKGYRGQKIAIIGDVGSGKSSLIAALLGQMRQVGGKELKVYGSTSYVPQQAWMLNMTMRDNILFGLPMDPKRYNEVVRVCSLERDFSLLVKGDKTQISERGANLSGGQRQRASLARAVYHDSDVILLDDPISAVDQHVGRHIFDECFMGFLKSKTVIVAMHQLQYLPQVDWIVVMKKGKIQMQGTYEQLCEINDFSELVKTHVAADDDAEQDDDFVDDDEGEDEFFSFADASFPSRPTTLQSLTSNRISNKTLSARLSAMFERNQSHILKGYREGEHSLSQLALQNELSVHSVAECFSPTSSRHSRSFRGSILSAASSRSSVASTQDTEEQIVDESVQGHTLGSLVRAYFSAGNGMAMSVFICILFSLVHLIRIGSDYWIRMWVPRIGNYSDAVYLGVYGLLVGLFSLGVFFRGYLFAKSTLLKATQLHQRLFQAAIRAKMGFYDATPLGRVLSAFSKHIYHIDDAMPDAAMQMLQYLPLGLGALVLAAVLIPWNVFPALGLVLVAGLFVVFSNPVIEKTKNMEAVTKAPIFAHVTATLEGLFTIRVFHAQNRFDTLNIEAIDRHHEALFALNACRSFQALYLDILSCFIVYFTSLLIVLNRDVPGMDSIAGLALSNVLQMLVFVQWTVRMWGEVNAHMASVGQVEYYSQAPSEAPAHIPEKAPQEPWPTSGKIEFKDVVLRYQEFGVDVLKNVNLVIQGSEKIGIVGRTGSGKSTLLIALLRIVEVAKGSIFIDGVDIGKMGLDDLRKKIAIIPQEPVLFVGTVRYNLDPFGECSDEQIWKSLRAVGLEGVVTEMPGKLDTMVIENGANFSLGQRQCFCIARAVLAKTRILVLDEATAAIDMSTDLLIQNTIKEAFADLTVLTIAHRLNTIIESNRVLVMDAGIAAEFDEPSLLLKNPDSIFTSLVDQTGAESAARLRDMADSAYQRRHALATIQEETSDLGEMVLGSLKGA